MIGSVYQAGSPDGDKGLQARERETRASHSENFAVEGSIQ